MFSSRARGHHRSVFLSPSSAAAMATNPETTDVEQLKSEMMALMRHLRIISHHTHTIPLTISGLQFDQPNFQLSEPFYSHSCGYKLCLRAELTKSVEKADALIFVMHACLVRGQFDYELEWPVKARITIQIQNQNGTDSDHIQRSKQVSWQYKSLGEPLPIPVMTDVDAGLLTMQGGGAARYVVRDTLQLTVKYMALEK